MSALRGQAPLPDFPNLDDEPTDRIDRIIRRRRSDEDTEKLRQMWRLTVKEEFVQERLKVLPNILGPDPMTAEEWADRGLRGLEISMVEGSGISPTAAKAYEEACFKRAVVANPRRYGPKMDVTADVRVTPRVIDSSMLSPEQRDTLRGLVQSVIEQREAEGESDDNP